MKLKPRDVLFWMHLIAGVVVGGVILIMAVTGTIMAFEPQIVEYAEKSVRVVEVPAQAQRLGLNMIVAKAAEYKKGKAGGLMLKSSPDSSVAVNFGRDGGVVYVNPYTGAILGGESKAHDFMHTVEDIHRWLGNKDIGRPVTGVSVMAFLFLLISGIYLWWPRNWRWNTVKYIVNFNPNAKGKARDWNWHNVIGFWAAPLLLITTVTGAIMAHQWANDLLYRLAGSEPPPAQARPAKEPGKAKSIERKEKRDEKIVDFDAVAARATEKVTKWESLNIRLPQKPDAPITVYIQEPNAVPVNARSQLSLDAASLNVAKWEPYREYDLGRKLRVWTKTVHTGEAGGMIGQMLAIASATAAIFLVYTGFAMSWRRFFIKEKI
jgi:uncharacterized iron-regulated membrane protein